MSTESDKETKNEKIAAKKKRNPPKWPIILVLSVIAVLFFGAIIALLWVSRSPEIIKPDENTKFFTDSFLNLVIVAVVLIQSIIYVYQWLSMRDVIAQNERLIRAAQRQALAADKGLKHAQDAFFMGNRAYLTIKYMTLVNKPLESNKTPIISYRIINGGSTPAFEVTCGSRTVITTNPFPEMEAEHGKKLMKGASTAYLVSGDDLAGMVSQTVTHGDAWFKEFNSGNVNAAYYIGVLLTWLDIEKSEQRIIFWYQYSEKYSFVLINMTDATPNKASKKQNPN